MELRKVSSVLDLVGGTPLVRINRMNPAAGVELLVKLESRNPGGSVKDRIGLYMIEAAERGGELKPGKVVLEASSGNTAIGLAMVCAVKGYRLVVTMSESASEERKKILRAYGAEIVLTPGHMGTDGAIEEAYRLARESPEKYVLVDQFNNEANWRAHYEGTAREIWDATGGRVDVVVLTMGTTGTLMGCVRAFRELSPKVRVVGVEPFKGHRIQGLKNMKESYPPGIFNPEEVDAIVNVEDEPAYATARRLAREEGILAGMSAGAAMRVAIDEAVRLGQGTVVTLLPDSGERYLSTSLFVTESVRVPVKLFNTLTRKLEELAPVRPGKVGLYSCGPSLDGPPDLGLCRRMVVADLLRRHLESRGLEVRHAVNLGDIDDRTVGACLAAGLGLKEFTARWEQAFREGMAQLSVLPAHHFPRASEHVQDMIDEARRLLDKGVAYEKLRSVYFRIARFPEYGKLAGIDVSAVKQAAATAYDYYEKDSPQDFALFKRSSLAELKAGIYWATPWGNARPGWHVECSAMAVKHLGQPFDVHAASMDLVFPHGDNEIAIAEALTGKPLAKVWLHSEVVMADGRKVSRAAGNDVTLPQVLASGVSPRAARYWLLATHYRTVLRYGAEEMARAEAAVARLDEAVARLAFVTDGGRCPDLDQWLFEARARYTDALDADLNVPQALGHVFGVVRKVNGQINRRGIDREQAGHVLEFLRGVDRTLAVIDFAPMARDDEVERLVAERSRARAAGEWAKADGARSRLHALGVEVIDTPSGTRWRRR